VRALAATVIALAAVAAATGSAATAPATLYLDPAWSPDGKSIAFVDNGVQPGAGPLGGHLYVMDASGANVHQLVDGTTGNRPLYAFSPTWSPDGKQIAFTYGSGISAVNRDGTGLRLVMNRGAAPDWSPGGKKIAFSLGDAEVDVPNKIYVVNPDGSNRTLVAGGKDECYLGSPAWSPNGQRLAFGISGDCVFGLGMITRYGGATHLLARGQAGGDLDWSPGGRRIAYTLSYKIAVLDVRTGRRTIVHSGYGPSWSPNSRRIVFSEGTSIDVMNADGTEVSQIFPR
jgi:dipeptidyl aminopeptidase/acylaminoacyl peptidase